MNFRSCTSLEWLGLWNSSRSIQTFSLSFEDRIGLIVDAEEASRATVIALNCHRRT
ncbi:MAG: IstB-like ATP-binding domain-containing protein [Candidatus Obscuribacter sp.]|nr:IstB-like ATP-binding domain-containing protein [Candidatus Obscuribacter sp.]